MKESDWSIGTIFGEMKESDWSIGIIIVCLTLDMEVRFSMISNI